MEEFQTETVYEVASQLRCSPRKVATVAREHGIGAQLGGSAGWRFTEADKRALWNAMKPSPPPAQPRRRRRRRAA